MWKLTLASMGAGIALLFLMATPAKADDAAAIKLFKDNKCTQCHAIDALKIEKVKGDEEEKDEADEGGKKVDPPDLGGAGKEHDAAFISKWLMKEEKIEGKKHKKKFKGSPEDLKVLSDWLATLKYDVPKK